VSNEGTLIRYSDKKLSAGTLELVRVAGSIMAEYRQQNLVLTLRQLYYQFVQRKVLPNTMSSYNRIGNAVSDGRMAGLLPWDGIEDRTRNLMGLRTYRHPGEAIREAKAGYRRDLWEGQPMRPEVWIEKEALSGVIAGICNELRVDFFSCRGYNSQSEQWRAGQRFAGYYQRGQRPIVLHLGDHDPSGLDMTRDNRERLQVFCGVPVAVQRLALNKDQVEQHNLPPDPAKHSDSRFQAYQEEFGDESWELDALDPRTIRELISTAVGRLRDPDAWNKALAREAEDLDTFDNMLEEMGM
jgi:hypothetical protein